MDWLPYIFTFPFRVLGYFVTPDAPFVPPDPPANGMVWFPVDTWVGTFMDFEDTEAIQCSDWMLDKKDVGSRSPV
ncbi:uncharacterized protein LDX57_002968 [Aspergillus melleus]|uniref:uncharacterized protein n=1 Tax=Aspergillus melleus TaxID=138277 RepID=UPI001E8DE479|nr:uncharacterized protein LDX57_002968 [Aspergillus melleus]KAH8425210.1 hypothetical protein LDX57_002968 [Aspergillus melleus]